MSGQLLSIALGLAVGVLLLALWAGWRLQRKLDDLSKPSIRVNVNTAQSSGGPIVRIEVENVGPSGEFTARTESFAESTADTWKVPWGHTAEGIAFINQGDREYLYLARIGQVGVSPLRVGLNKDGTYRLHDVRTFHEGGIKASIQLFHSEKDGAVNRVSVLIDDVPQVLNHEHKLVGGDWRVVDYEAISS